MKFFSVLPYLFAWHYTNALAHFFVVWGNFFWFVGNYFSFSVLLKTLFSPYKKLTEKYEGGLNLDRFFESLVVNFIMRVVGFLMRVVVLLIGLLALFGVLVLGLLTLVVWIALPFLLILIFLAGLAAFFGKNHLTF